MLERQGRLSYHVVADTRWTRADTNIDKTRHTRTVRESTHRLVINKTTSLSLCLSLVPSGTILT